MLLYRLRNAWKSDSAFPSLRHTFGKSKSFNARPSLSTMLSKIGNTSLHEIIGSGCKFGSSVSLTRVRSIFSMTNEPRSGVNPAPVILIQPVSLNLLRLFTASMHSITSLIFVSDSLDARLLSISPKSITLIFLLSRIDVMMAASSSLLSLSSMEFFRATAKRAREGMARKLATCDNTPVGTADREQHLVIVVGQCVRNSLMLVFIQIQ